jgi:DNA-binding GntR family transcriptional regulator
MTPSVPKAQLGGGEEGQNGEAVFERVRTAILNAELAPGAVMSQVALAEQLGVSRTPLREALRLLQGEGLVEAEPNRRVRVAPMTARDLEELYVLRVALEAESIRLSIPQMTPEDLAQLEGRMAEMAHYAEAKDYVRWTGPHREFHRELTNHVGRRVSAALSRYFDHAERYRRLHIGQGPSAWATAGHREILDACKAGDRDLGASLLVSHLARTGLEVCELLEPDYQPQLLIRAIEDVGGTVPKRKAKRTRS